MSNQLNDMMPMNIQAEQGLLGSIIIDPAAFFSVDFLKPTDFYRDAHQQIYEVMKFLVDRQRPAEFITICDELDHRNKLEEVGGASYITSLINEVPTSGNAEHYAHIVEQLSVRRRLLKAAAEIAAAAQNDSADEAMASAEEAILSINTERNVTTYKPVSDIMSRCMDRMNIKATNGMIGLATGFSDLDRILRGLRKKSLYIVAARPAQGKTSFTLKLAYNAARKGAKVAFFELEMGDEDLGFRLISIQTKIDSTRIQLGEIDDEEWDLVSHKMMEISETPLTIDETGNLSVEQLYSRCRQMQAKGGLDLVVVDYLQLLSASKGGKPILDKVSEVSEISRKLKLLAKALDIPVVALAQLSRAVESRQSKVPQLSDLRESGQIEQDADAVVFMYRPEYYDPETERKGQADIIIAKNRSGPIGQVTMRFSAYCTDFSDLETILQER